MNFLYLFIKPITKRRIALMMVVLSAAFFLWPSGPLFPDDYSRVVTDRNGNILRVTLANDGQFRLEADNSNLPDKYIKAVTMMEDRRFFYHPGVDPFSILNSFVCNIRAGKRLRGASTLTMQVVRLSNPRSRTYLRKSIECVASLKLTVNKSKIEILKLYAAHAPMGGNIAGIWSASRYYFGKPLQEITWAEAALFAVLPNSPSMININKQRPKLKIKRDRLIKTLYNKGIIDSITSVLAIDEPLPPVKSRLAFEAPHFSQRALQYSDSKLVTTTLDMKIQGHVESIIRRYSRDYHEYGVANMAVLVINNINSEVSAYAGSQDYYDTARSGRVDGVKAPRSSGSLLKPLLAARAIDRGPWVIQSRIQDIPTFYGTFAPSNAAKDFQGIVTVEQMLIQSLNIPAVRLLYEYGYNDFYSDLKEMGVSTLLRRADGYGLSIILGGAEVSLWDMCRIYSGLSNEGLIRSTKIVTGEGDTYDTSRLCSPGASWLILSSINKLNRPDNEKYWESFSEQIPVAWKTGTSYGQKDAWAIGVNKQWTIGVWVGNFTGESNTFLGGAVSAAPVMFTLFRQLTDLSRPVWFQCPEYDLKRITVCSASGYLPGPYCPQTTEVLQPSKAWKTEQCPWHRKIVIDKKSGKEVCSRCWSGIDRKDTVLLIYPAAAVEIMRSKGLSTDIMPAHLSVCNAVQVKENNLSIEYPVNGITIFIPRDLDGEYQQVVCKASGETNSIIYWYLDGDFIGETKDIHNKAITCNSGKHVLSIFNNDGGESRVSFMVVKK
ncbi:MAG TPA: penicillin-binding protein 1C [Chitinispirillaceae bacterium]|nr:penicillin-binding protein 1C [Chitinispirillaceae bacterium]